jgi:hypothetical protein
MRRRATEVDKVDLRVMEDNMIETANQYIIKLGRR